MIESTVFPETVPVGDLKDDIPAEFDPNRKLELEERFEKDAYEFNASRANSKQLIQSGKVTIIPTLFEVNALKRKDTLSIKTVFWKNIK